MAFIRRPAARVSGIGQDYKVFHQYIQQQLLGPLPIRAYKLVASNIVSVAQVASIWLNNPLSPSAQRAESMKRVFR